MGLFGSIVHAFTSPVEHLIGKTATNVLFPVVPISHVAASIVDKVASGLMTPANVSQVPIQQRPGVYPVTSPGPNITYGSPGFQQPYYGGGGGFTPSYQPTEQLYGGSPWGSSIQSFQPSTPQYQTYSAPTQDRSWEDLILGAAPLFL